MDTLDTQADNNYTNALDRRYRKERIEEDIQRLLDYIKGKELIRRNIHGDMVVERMGGDAVPRAIKSIENLQIQLAELNDEF